MRQGSSVPLSRGLSGADQAAPLDTNAKFVGHPVQDGVSEGVNRETGEVLQSYDPLLKWELQDVARRYLPTGHRLANCHRVRREDSSVQLRMSEERQKAFYSGLQTCGLVWLCPVCAPKIQAVRSSELEQAIERAEAEGLVVDLVTLTLPHRRGQTLAELEGVLRHAYRSMQNARGYRELRKELGLAGTVASEELTWGPETGWHPHLHVLRFRAAGPVSKQGKMTAADLRLFELWRSAVERRGWESPKLAGFSVQDGSQAHAYVQKLGDPKEAFTWRLSDEMARSHTKRGRGLRYTPFDFLRMGAEDAEGPWRGLWREYAEVYKGRQQLRWSKGLRERLGVVSQGTDEQIAESVGERWTWARELSSDDWALVRRHRARGVLLQVAEQAGRSGVDLYLRELGNLTKSASAPCSTGSGNGPNAESEPEHRV